MTFIVYFAHNHHLRQAPKKEADTFDLDDDEDVEDVEEAEEFEKDYNFRFEVEEGRQGIGSLMCA